MASTSISPQTACTAAPLPLLDVDLVIVPWFEGDAATAVPGVDGASGRHVASVIDSKEFSGRAFETFSTPVTDASWRARRLLLSGAGKRERFTSDMARRMATAAALWATSRHIRSAAFVLRVDAPAGDAVELAQAVAEGLTLADFDAGSYKTAEATPRNAPSWVVSLAGPADLISRAQTAVARGRILGECSNLARQLCNEPSNTLTPREFARRASDIAGQDHVTVEILDEAQIATLGMGMLLGVARGSVEPPRLMVFRYDPPSAPATPVLGLVGKGITFDSGGISIKHADGMERMKNDMAGGAAVVCAMRAISLLQAPIRVVGIVPTTENMPGGKAIKPGDILRSAAGKTVEIINTDAEGRLILGEGLWYAQQLGATHLVDVATLTGAIVVALGKVATGLFGTPDDWVAQVRRVADRAGDRAWPMPIFEEYRDQLKSEIADFTNTGGRPAGASTAAMFLNEFTGGLPWVHMDIAGTSWAEDSKPYMPPGPTGVAVRTLAELAFSFGR